MFDPQLFATGLTWPESPRWRGGFLWISDVHGFRLVRIPETGEVEEIARIPGRPSGMDIDADGSILLATALDGKALRIDGNGEVAEEADLSPLTLAYLNDIVTNADGWTWMGDTGFVFGRDEPVPTGRLIAYHPENGNRVVADGIFFPNGMAISPDGATLYLAETFGKRISSFRIGNAGSLTGRGLHAELPGSPDGICIDEEGCLWVALLFEGLFVRLAPDGTIIDRISFPNRNAIACMLGGEEGRTLYLCVAEVDRTDPDNLVRRGEIYTVPAPSPAVKRP